MQKMKNRFKISQQYSENADVVLFNGECLDLLKRIPDGAAMLVVTSPPYNLGKEYEKQKPMKEYLKEQATVIAKCVRILHPQGSICWQVGNYIRRGEIFPLDILLYQEFKKHGLKLKNRIIWHFGNGLHCKRRFSGRHESILWFVKDRKHIFNLDPVRIPQTYPRKRYHKGKKKGQLSGHPLGKNPGDTWIIPNVMNTHVEKTAHPCQFPVGLVERLILSLTNKGDLVVDPFMGSGTTAVAAVLHGRRCAGADREQKYLGIARERIMKAKCGTLKYKSFLQRYNDRNHNNENQHNIS